MIKTKKWQGDKNWVSSYSTFEKCQKKNSYLLCEVNKMNTLQWH